ncbi:MAG TPA: hypothetical protein P5273_12210 [Syntrophomonadaceae bacterium]|jgi:hypothetical protein|uniref:Uncharacterized protein n=1 Tax=Methanothrix harundinacea TaxID=301375 RepID=A0A124G2M6_9EURY|nr:MAG: hypothetical protein XE07_2192 [Methanothrix harundinacea]MDD5515644.1 hypothetical protein [Synergistales bacterium]HRX22463.1 hypothetical protein [Syntrophomonadaceae bacterium]
MGLNNTKYFALLRRYRTQRTISISAGIFIIGLAFLALSAYLSDHPVWQSIIMNLGSLCVVSIVVTLIWELFAKNAFLNEVETILNFNEDLRTTGLCRASNDYLSIIDWEKQLAKVSNLDILVIYANTWRQTPAIHETLRILGDNADVKVRLVVPDPEDGKLMGELGQRLNKNSNDIKSSIKEAVGEYKSIFSKNLSVWYLSSAPLFAMYRLDDTIVLTLYSHRRDREKVPTFIFRNGGTMYEFLVKEFDTFVDEDFGLSRTDTIGG